MNDDYYGPMWIDPRYWGQYRKQLPPRRWGEWETTTTTTPAAPGMTEEQVRKIVREEIADLPIPFDVPDELPEDADG